MLKGLILIFRKRRKLRIQESQATKEHEAVVKAVGRFMKVWNHLELKALSRFAFMPEFVNSSDL